MLAKVLSYGLCGLDAFPIAIEVDIARGLPSTTIVGLPDNAVKESKERVRSAIRNSGYQLPPQKITINLSPADIRKEGPSFDLSMAVGILAASGRIEPDGLRQYAFLGELSLGGHIQPVTGTLSVAMRACKDSLKGLILPLENAKEAAIVNNATVYPAKTLNQVIQFLKDQESIKPLRQDMALSRSRTNHYDVDFAEVKGQYHVKRGLEVAAAGGHNILMIGPPGSGKTMLAKRLPTILPEMTLEESLETTRIHSALGLKNKTGLVSQRPFRAPHHTTSDVALIGGGSFPKPGEVSLAHNGILFLDELPEFNRNVLEALRQPLEDRCVHISRASKSISFPSSLMLVCAMNPCPCGHYTNPRKSCHCTQQKIQRYLSKISGPLLDRIDIHLEVPALPPMKMDLPPRLKAESSADIKRRTTRAREIQQQRFVTEAKHTPTFCNAQMTPQQVKQSCVLSQECADLLKTAIEELELSSRANDKIIKVARTIADLDNSKQIQTEHIAEAIQYRSLDRSWFS